MLKYLRTIKYLLPSQLIHRILKKISFPIFPHNSNLNLRSFFEETFKYNFKKKSIVAINEFNFLNIQIKFINGIKWNDEKQDKLWNYNLHYFDGILDSENDKKKYLYTKIIYDWIDNNKKYEGVGWDPYPTSIRLVNFVKWVISNRIDDKKILNSIADQANYLFYNFERDILANHIVANAKALIFVGLIFDNQFSKQMYNKGIKTFENEIKKQILADGGHFELSPMYHLVILEDILDIVSIHRYFKLSYRTLDKEISNMFRWGFSMTHNDFHLSFFNDSCHGVSSNILDLLDYANKLNFNIKLKSDKKELIDLDSSGYFILANENAKLIFDTANVVASYQPGHSHSDTLSFEMSIGFNRFIVNSGISTYNSNKLRLYQRGTSAHSSLTINDKDSSEVWSSFRLGRRAKIISRSSIAYRDHLHASGAHDGYTWMSGSPIVSREIKLYDRNLHIFDYIHGTNVKKINSYFPLHPNVKLIRQDNNIYTFELKGREIIIIIPNIYETKVKNTLYFDEFNKSMENLTIELETSTELPFEGKVKISW